MASSRSLVLGAVLALSFLAALGGCGDDASSEGGGGSSAPDGGAAGHGGGGTGGGTGAYVGFGSITLLSSALAAESSSTASASFTLAQGDDRCTTTIEGDCTVVVCDLQAGAPASEFRSAGEVSVDGGLRAVTLSPDADDRYAVDASTTELLFNGGETLSVHAAGSAEIPAFDGSVVAPSKVTVGSPSFSGTLNVDRASDLTFGWTGGAQGDLQLVVGVTTRDGADVTGTATVSCVVPAQPGAGTIPASTLGALPATDADDLATVSVSGFATTQLDAGDWSVQLDAYMSGVTPTGLAALVSATLD